MSMLPRTDCEGFHRRDFLQVGSAGLLGLTLPGALRAAAAMASHASVEVAKGLSRYRCLRASAQRTMRGARRSGSAQTLAM